MFLSVRAYIPFVKLKIPQENIFSWENTLGEVTFMIGASKISNFKEGISWLQNQKFNFTEDIFSN